MSHTSNETLTDQSFVSADQPMPSSPKPGTRPRPKKKSLPILIVNFQSLRKKGKLPDAIIIDSDPDIIIGSETWLDKSIASSEVLPNDLGFDIQRKDRLQYPHGGVLIAARRDLQLRNIHCSETIELISGTVTVEGNQTICIASYYRPQNRTDEAYIDNTRQEIDLLMGKKRKNIFLIDIFQLHITLRFVRQRRLTLEFILEGRCQQ